MQTAARKPITAATRFSITPAGSAALRQAIEQAPSGVCPMCEGRLRVINFYQGGVGYVPYDFCPSPACDYSRRRTS